MNEFFTPIFNFDLPLTDLVCLKDIVYGHLLSRHGDLIDYRKFMNQHGPVGYDSPARDWYSVVFSRKNNFGGSEFVADFISKVQRRIQESGLPTFAGDYLQIHVTNTRGDSSHVIVPPHRDVNRMAGLNFSVWNTSGSATTFWEDFRVKSGQITVQESLAPESEFLVQRAAIEYGPSSAYLIDATQLHGVRTAPSNVPRFVAAYAFRREGQSVPYAELAPLIRYP
jgi:hypothetical protein